MIQELAPLHAHNGVAGAERRLPLVDDVTDMPWTRESSIAASTAQLRYTNRWNISKNGCALSHVLRRYVNENNELYTQ